MFRNRKALLLTVAAIAGAGCTAGPIDGPDPDMTRDEARALASYLLSMKKDDAVPYAINYRRDKKKAQ